MLDRLPVFGVFGHHESGKTTLIEQLLPRLLDRGLSVAVAKVHGSHIEVDRPGKDSHRLFEAGADVFMRGKTHAFLRTHIDDRVPVVPALTDLARRYDLVLVEGRKRARCEKVWLLGEGEGEPPPEAGDVLAVLPRDSDRVEAAWQILEEWLARRWLQAPVYGCVLIGGRSSRMGTPKHLLQADGVTWLERTVVCVRPHVERVVIVGDGDVPAALSGVTPLGDAPDAEGPMAGVLAAMRWAPQASWLVAACDLPNLSPETLEWLLSTRAPGVWVTLPRLPEDKGFEPLLAHYDFRARGPLEEAAADGNFSLSALAAHPKVCTPTPPADLCAAWQNVNRPPDL